MLKLFRLVISIVVFMCCSSILAEERSLNNSNPVFEVVKWKSKSDISDKETIDAVNSMAVDLKILKGFLQQSLYKNSNDEWVDVYYWKTLEDAQDSDISMSGKDSFKRLIELIEPNSVSIEIMREIQSSGGQFFGR